MISNLEKHKKDLEKLISFGKKLMLAIQYESYPKEFEKQLKAKLKEEYPDYIKKIPNFTDNYQIWHSESLILMKQLLPDRISDFVRLYEKPKNRKTISYENYVIEDYLQQLTITNNGREKVGPSAAIPKFQQQLIIIQSIEKRFESSLFDIRQVVQANLFDSELETSKELNKKGFTRAAGAVAGVVLEGHLAQVCINHNIKIQKKNPSISDYNDQLKTNEVFETPTWRKIQHLGDLRNLCDHKKEKEPSKDDLIELIEGVEKIIKTIF